MSLSGVRTALNVESGMELLYELRGNFGSELTDDAIEG
jgi:hypothetical protein